MTTVPAAGRVAVAAPNGPAAQAGARMGAEGGNAVDAAVAAMIVACISEPGIVSLGGGGFVTVAPQDDGPSVTVDGYVEMPGRGLPRSAFGCGTRDVTIDYGGGTAMTVGHGSVATPGVLAALDEAHRRYGRLPWRILVEPATELARAGFALGAAADHYFEFSREQVFGHDAAVRAALHHADGTPLRAAERMVIPDLAPFLERLAAERSAAFYTGEVARALVADMAANGGLITHADLAAYRPVVRPATVVDLPDWRIATNPPPAIGGPVLAAMLVLTADRAGPAWTAPELASFVRVVRAVLAYRAEELDVAPDRAAAGRALLDGVLATGRPWLTAAPSTAHVSVVDAAGGACSVTASSGYGAGVSVPGTGVWLNNCLGEHELNRRGLHSLPPGERLASNMAPTVGRRRDGAVLAIGSPGADRITTALAQVISAIVAGADLQAAIDHPRLHVRRTAHGAETLDHEAGLALPEALLPPIDELPRTRHEALSMYFGGVAAAMVEPNGRLLAAADPRRDGATALG